MLRYTVMRRVEATGPNGPTKIAVALIEHENGQRQRVAIPEDEIRFAGEGLIDIRVQEAASNPGTYSLKEEKSR